MDNLAYIWKSLGVMQQLLKAIQCVQFDNIKTNEWTKHVIYFWKRYSRIHTGIKFEYLKYELTKVPFCV